MRKTLIHCGKTTFICHNEFFKYMKVGGAILDDVFDYLSDPKTKKFLSKNEKRHILDIFQKWDLECHKFDEDFDDYLDDEEVKDIIRDEGIRNLYTDN